MGFTCITMLAAILVTSASITLGWFIADLVANLLLTAPFTFWPLPDLGTSPHFLFGIDLVVALDEV